MGARGEVKSAPSLTDFPFMAQNKNRVAWRHNWPICIVGVVAAFAGRYFVRQGVAMGELLYALGGVTVLWGWYWRKKG